MSDLREARTSADIVRAALAAVWSADKRDGDPPDCDQSTLAEWIGYGTPQPGVPKGWRGGRVVARDASGRPVFDADGNPIPGPDWLLIAPGREGDPERGQPLEWAHSDWIEAAEAATGNPPKHPLADVLRAWIDRPPIVKASTRPDPLLPVVQSVSEPAEREAGRLAFGGILDAGEATPGQLPLFPAPDGPRVAVLELVDAHGVPTMTRGRGAPLELAVYVGACVFTPFEARARRARLVTTVRELASFLFGPGRWKPGSARHRHWERTRDAALHASNLWLPVPHPDGAPDLWRAVAVRKIPPADYDPSYLDREVVFDVELPSGSSDGPVIDRRELSRLRRESAPRFRAYLAAHSVAWRPGRTRVPHPGNRRFRVWTGDPSKYPIVTAEDRDRLAFGHGWEDRARKEGRQKADAHWEQLPGSVIVTRKTTTPDGRRGWLIVPDKAAEAIRKRRDG